MPQLHVPGLHARRQARGRLDPDHLDAHALGRRGAGHHHRHRPAPDYHARPARTHRRSTAMYVGPYDLIGLLVVILLVVLVVFIVRRL